MTAKQTVSGLATYTQRAIDRVVSPETRSDVYNKVNTFAHEQPLLFSFLAILAFYSSIPLVLFTTFVASTILFSFGTAIIFVLFWLSLSLVVLVPTLFVTTGLSVVVWAWAVGTWAAGSLMYSYLPAVYGKGEVVVKGDGGKANGKKFVVDKDEHNGIHVKAEEVTNGN